MPRRESETAWQRRAPMRPPGGPAELAVGRAGERPSWEPGGRAADPAFTLRYHRHRQNLDHRSLSFLSPWDVWGHMRSRRGRGGELRFRRKASRELKGWLFYLGQPCVGNACGFLWVYQKILTEKRLFNQDRERMCRYVKILKGIAKAP